MVAILVASAAVWLCLVGLLGLLFFALIVPTLQYGGRGEIPTDFPVYPGAHLESAYSSSLSGCVSLEATWSTADDATAVVAFYNDRLAAGDWTITGVGNGRIDFTSASGPPRSGTVYVRGNQYAKQTVIDVTMTESPADPNVKCLSGRGG